MEYHIWYITYDIMPGNSCGLWRLWWEEIFDEVARSIETEL